MDRSEWSRSTDVDALLRFAATFAPGSELRCFACEVSRRVLPVYRDSRLHRIIEFAESRSSGSYSAAELEAVKAEATKLYDEVYPGYGSPSARALAVTAAGEAAFTEEPLKAAIAASATAALAVAGDKAEKADEKSYDAVHDDAYHAERSIHAEVLR